MDQLAFLDSLDNPTIIIENNDIRNNSNDKNNLWHLKKTQNDLKH